MNQWFAARTWAESQDFAAAHADELLRPAAVTIIENLSGQQPRNPTLRMYRGLLGYAAVAGFATAYQLTADADRLQSTLGDPDTPLSERLALARLRSGQSADDPEAHFDLTVTTLLAGNPQEASAAIADCADHAAPYEQRELARRLTQLEAERPDLALHFAELKETLSVRPPSDPDQ